MIKYKIIDNFLSDSDFTELTNYILPIPTDLHADIIQNFGWDYTSSQVGGGEEQDRFKKVTDIEILNPINDWYLSHVLHFQSYHSPALRYISPLLRKINPLAVYRIRC